MLFFFTYADPALGKLNNKSKIKYSHLLLVLCFGDILRNLEPSEDINDASPAKYMDQKESTVPYTWHGKNKSLLKSGSISKTKNKIPSIQKIVAGRDRVDSEDMSETA